MLYAVNLYDLVEGKENVYREYVRQTFPLTNGIDMEQIAAGCPPYNAIQGVARGHFIVIRFGSMDDFNTLMARQKANNVDKLREEATENYVWTLYQNWDIAHWLGTAQ
jgi:hypothetical protein